MTESQRITVSEDKLDAKLASLELRLVDRITGALEAKADAAVVKELREKVHALQGTVQAVAHLPGEVTKLVESVASLQESRAAAEGLSSYQRWLVGCVCVGLLSAIATLVWLAAGG